MHRMQNTPISMIRVRLWVRFRIRVRLGVVLELGLGLGLGLFSVVVFAFYTFASSWERILLRMKVPGNESSRANSLQ